MSVEGLLPSSFRDPAGFVFRRDGVLHRAILKAGQPHYDALMTSGLYDELAKDGLIVAHKEASVPDLGYQGAYKIIRPEEVPFVSYPYEWSFSMLRDAALATLEIQKRALRRGLTLVDASAFNVQFLRGRATLIDTLSFRRAAPGAPWTAYRQFCQHFLAPLALMSFKDVRLSQLMRVYLDGIPLDLASSLLPFHTRRRFSLLLHIHLHARSQKRFEGRKPPVTAGHVGPRALMGLIDSLESGVKKLRWRPAGTEWGNYYGDTNYSEKSFADKKNAVADFLEAVRPRTVWDMGGNIGEFSRLAASRGAFTVSFDIDPACIEMNYLRARAGHEHNILPLLIDLTNPSPGAGWENRERMSLVERGPADAVLALALVHHLAIGNNVPLEMIARMLSHISRSALVEFIPKSDSQIQRLFVVREDIFGAYTQEGFERAFSEHFTIQTRRVIKDSLRSLYWMERR